MAELKTEVRGASGLLYNYADLENMPVPTVYEIAAHISKEQRFGGACKHFYSVAQHAVNASVVADELSGGDPIIALYTLHHDDHEFILKDAMTPLKNYIFMRTGIDVYEELSEQLDEVIFGEMLGLPYPMPDHIHEIVAEADKRMYVSEGMALVRNFEHKGDTQPASFSIEPVNHERAERAYLDRHANLVRLRGRRRV